MVEQGQIVFTDSKGCINYLFDGLRHREDGPAFFCPRTLEEQWWYRGKLHRLDGPADYKPKMQENGLVYETWYVHGKTHRDGGPAHTNPFTKTRFWYQDGEIHRDDGPAVISGAKEIYYWRGEKLRVRTLKGFLKIRPLLMMQDVQKA